MRKELKFIELIKLSVVFQHQRWIFLQNFNFKIQLNLWCSNDIFNWKKILSLKKIEKSFLLFSLTNDEKRERERERKINILASKNNNEIIILSFALTWKSKNMFIFCRNFLHWFHIWLMTTITVEKTMKKNQNLMHSTHWMNEWMNIVSGNQRKKIPEFHSFTYLLKL